MRRLFITSFLIGVLLVSSCGGGTTVGPTRFLKPRWVASAPEAVSIKGSATKIVYVSNFLGGDIIPIDTEKFESIDTDLFNDELTSIAVGGKLGKLLVEQSRTDGFSFDIYAESKEERAIYLLRAEDAGSETQRFLGHSMVDIGSTVVCTASSPFLDDHGNSSNPSLSNIELAAGVTKTENWMVKYSSSDGVYTVEGSVSGLQANLASEDVQYTSDDGGLSFMIFGGSRTATKNDAFLFGTTCAKPLLLSGEPGGFTFSHDRLFVAIEDSEKVSVYNKSDFSFIQDINLNDGSGDTVEPNGIVELGAKLYVSNGNGSSLWEIDPGDFSTTFFDLGEAVSHISVVSGIDNMLYILPEASSKILVFSTDTNTVSTSVSLSEVPRGFIGISDDESGNKRALVSKLSPEVDEFNLTDLTLVDQNQRSGNESYSLRSRFVDELPVSSPKLVEVSTVDGVTKTERWVLTYNGTVAQTYSQTGTVTAKDMNDANSMFQTLGVIAGDILVINPFEETKEEIEIESVTDENNLSLVSEPSSTGSNITYHIRSSGNYVVYGSESGLQKNRVTEGYTYTTDAGSLSLNVISSVGEPTTEGDYFTFLTDDGIDSVSLINKMLPFHMTVVARESDAKEYVYVANEGSNNISVIDISRMKEKTTID